ncbi:hypothetical protein N0V88_006761 [Collariella sp. IMI 366227]|nr:hypothetical protein N0V88_006761 [Collariella sp. IMI 366227]
MYQQPAQHELPRQRSKLHKPADPRGHKYTDSGVGITEPEHTQRTDESRWRGPSEAVGGGTYARDTSRPIHPFESIRSDLDTITPTQEDIGFYGGSNRDTGFGATGGMTEPKKFDNTHQQSARDSPPYWGSLPKGAGVGGVYNTVTGHGSATDDHDEHHHVVPRKSALSDTSIIAERVADYPRGSGVYNTVIGAGSQDDERRRSSLSSRDSADERHADDDRMDEMYGTFLPDIPEQQTPLADTLSTAPGFLPETAIRDDVRLAEAAARNSARPNEPTHSDPASQRSFPLTEGHNDRRESSPSHRGAAAAGAAGIGAGVAASKAMGKRRSDASPARDARSRSRSNPPGEPATTGKRIPSQHRSPALDQNVHHTEESPKSEKKHSILGIFHRRKDSKDEGSPTRHRRKSSASHDHPELGAAAPSSPSRARKVSKGESAMQRFRSRSRSRSQAKPETEDHHGKEKAAAGAAAGAGAFGVLHHKKKNSISEPHGVRSSITGLSAAEGGAGPVEEAPLQTETVSTPFEHPREPPVPPPHGEQTHAGEHGHHNVLAGAIPSGVRHTTDSGVASNEPGKYNTLASGTPSGVSAAAAGPVKKDVMERESGDYSTGRSSGPPDLHHTRGDVSSQPRDHHMLAASGFPAHQETRGDVVPSGPGDFNTIRSRSTSDQVEDGRHHNSTGLAQQDLGNHHTTLAAAMPASTKRHSPTSAEPQQTRASPAQARAMGDNASVLSLEYNKLPSGTPSGVMVKPKSPRRSVGASGTSPERLSQQSEPPRQREDITTSTRDMKELPLPPTATAQRSDMTRGSNEAQQDRYHHQQYPHIATAAAAGLPLMQQQHQQQQQQQRSNQSPTRASEPGSGFTTFPHPEMVHNMSPEVMPDAYTSSVPRDHHQQQPFAQQQHQPAQYGQQQRQPFEQQPNQPFTQQQQQQPTGFGQQSFGQQQQPAQYGQQQQPFGQQQQPFTQQQQQQQPFAHQNQPSQYLPQQQQPFSQQQQQQHNINPALAAATTSWATSAGKSSGVGAGTADRSSGMGQGFGQGQGMAMGQGMGHPQGMGMGQGVGTGQGQGPMVHKCQHCGQDNDISGYFEKAQEWVGRRF